MRRLTFAVLPILLSLLGLAAAARPDLPSPTGPITDLAGILDNSTKNRLLQLIQDVRERTTAEIAILTIPTTSPETIQDYSVAVFDRWRIGKRGQDNGLLFVVAVGDRRLWITTGYGLEGILPDGRVGEIRDRRVIPYFRTGQYAEGILRGTEALAGVILAEGREVADGQRAVARTDRQRNALWNGSTGILLAVFLLLVLFSAGVSAVDRRRYVRGRVTRGRGRFWGPFWFGTGGGWSGGGYSGWSGGGFSSGNFGGFGGGSTGGGGAGGSW